MDAERVKLYQEQKTIISDIMLGYKGGFGPSQMDHDAVIHFISNCSLSQFEKLRDINYDIESKE